MNERITYIEELASSTDDGLLVVELFGLPGSGKTHIAKTIRSNFELVLPPSKTHFHFIDFYGENRVFRITTKLILVIRYGLARSHVRLVSAIIAKQSGLSVSQRIRLALNFFLILANIVRASKAKSMIVFDQGLLQGLWSCIYYSNCDLKKPIDINTLQLFCDLLRLLPVSRYFILETAASREVIKQRLTSRTIKGTTDLNSLDDDALTRGFRVTKSLSSQFRKFTASDGNFELLKI